LITTLRCVETFRRCITAPFGRGSVTSLEVGEALVGVAEAVELDAHAVHD
jgi:hypothetical protein